jgi:uncharacterized membrane protein YqjE
MNWLALLGLETFAARCRVAAIEGAIAAEDRLELARLEWEDQKRSLFKLAALCAAVAGLTVVSAVTISLAVIVYFWDTPYRSAAGGWVAGLWLLLWVVGLVALIRTARSAGQGFPLTRRELAQDWQDIKERL